MTISLSIIFNTVFPENFVLLITVYKLKFWEIIFIQNINKFHEVFPRKNVFYFITRL